MTIRKKIFMASAILIVLSVILLGGLFFVQNNSIHNLSDQSTKDLSDLVTADEHSQLDGIASNAVLFITKLEDEIDNMMLNSSLVLQAVDTRENVTLDEMKQIANETNVNDMYFTDINGNFTLSTVEGSAGLNLFDIWDGYKMLVTGEATVLPSAIKIMEETGEIYKFTAVPRYDSNGNIKGIIESALNASSIEDSLNDFVAKNDQLDGLYLIEAGTGLTLTSSRSSGANTNYVTGQNADDQTALDVAVSNTAQFVEQADGTILYYVPIQKFNAPAYTMVIESNRSFFQQSMEYVKTSNNKLINNSTDSLIAFIIIGILYTTAIILIFYRLISSSALKPIKRLSEVADNVSKGNLNINVSKPKKDETGVLEQSFYDVITVINRLVDDLHAMTQKISEEGDIDARIDGSSYTGAYKDVADGLNFMVNGIIQDILTFFTAINGVGDGDFDVDIQKLPGKKAIMNDTLDNFKRIIKSVNADINSLVNGALGGDLSKRADETAYSGGWVTLVNGLNLLVEAVAEPAGEIYGVMRRVSQGDFTLKMTGDYKGDFLSLEQSVNATVTNVASYIEEISGVLGELSDNDLDQGITREYVGSFKAIKEAVNNIAGTLNRVIGDISEAAEQVASGARSISENSMSLATGATEQAAAIEQLSATVQMINDNTIHNAENAKKAEKLSGSSKANAERGDENMSLMLKSMDAINESSDKISSIIKVIEEIAFQTNLLALNAAVEAARAGEHGKGFSVVAAEVRNLSVQSQAAAKETADLIEESKNRVADGTRAANKTAETLRLIVGDASEVASRITEITKASEEQTLAINQVMTGINQVTDVVQTNSATSEETASAAEQLASQSEVLDQLVRTFKLKKK